MTSTGAPVPGDRPANHFLRAMDAASYAALRPSLRRVWLAAGVMLCERGERIGSVYFPESGLLSAVTTLSNGQSVDVASRGRDGAVGYVEATGSEQMHGRVVVQIAGEALFAPASVYAAIYAKSPALQAMVWRRMEMLLAEGRQAAACQAFHSSAQRFAKLLLECRDHTGRDQFAVTQDFIASMVGAGRPAINRAARDFQQRGVIRYRHGQVAILDHGELRREACECYGVLRQTWRRLTGAETRRQPPNGELAPHTAGPRATLRDEARHAPS